MPDVFKHPRLELPPGKTVYLVVTGEHGMLQPQKAGEKSLISNTLEAVSNLDGTSQSVMVVEANADPARVRQIVRLTEFARELGGKYPLMEAMNAAYGEAVADGVGRYDIAEVFEHLMAEGPESRDIEQVLALLRRAG